MSTGRPHTSSFYLIGNRLAVDFSNTVRGMHTGKDAITGWEDLTDFLLAVGLVQRARMSHVRSLAGSSPEDTERVLQAALSLRTAVRSILEALAEGKEPEEEWVQPINELLRFTEGYDQLMRGESGWRIGLVVREQKLEWLLAAIARSAAEIVAEGREAPVRKCAGENCVLYFYDTSRTGRRRWCSMAACGNRSKVAAFALRRRKKKGGRGQGIGDRGGGPGGAR